MGHYINSSLVFIYIRRNRSRRPALGGREKNSGQCARCKSALVELLVARGAGPNVCDDEGHSPLYHAGYQKPMGDVIRKAGGYRSNIET